MLPVTYPGLCLLTAEDSTANCAAVQVVAHQTTELMRPVGWKASENVFAIIDRALPCSICIRMSTGTFLGYTRNTLLHCGISDAFGRVHHFDENGHGCAVWQECVSVVLLPAPQRKQASEEMCTLVDTWNQTLQQFHALHAGNGSKYHSTKHNCFHYVLEYLRYFGAAGGGKKEACSSFSGPPSIFRVLTSVALEHLEKRYVRPSMEAMETYLELLNCIEKQNQKNQLASATDSATAAAAVLELFHTYSAQVNEITSHLL